MSASQRKFAGVGSKPASIQTVPAATADVGVNFGRLGFSFQ
jgi:hypothetical protein